MEGGGEGERGREEEKGEGEGKRRGGGREGMVTRRKKGRPEGGGGVIES